MCTIMISNGWALEPRGSNCRNAGNLLQKAQYSAMGGPKMSGWGALRVIYLFSQERVKEGLTGGLAATAFRLNRDENRVYLTELFRIVRP